MGNLKAAFDSVLYAIGILCFCLLLAVSFNIQSQFGGLFSLVGIMLLAFCVFGCIAK